MIYLQFIEIALDPFTAKLKVIKRQNAAVGGESYPVKRRCDLAAVTDYAAVGARSLDPSCGEGGRVDPCKAAFNALAGEPAAVVRDEYGVFALEIQRIEVPAAADDLIQLPLDKLQIFDRVTVNGRDMAAWQDIVKLIYHQAFI